MLRVRVVPTSNLARGICCVKLAASLFSLSILEEILRGTSGNYLFFLHLSHTIIYIGLLIVAVTSLTSLERCPFRMSATSNFCSILSVPTKNLWIGHWTILQLTTFRFFYTPFGTIIWFYAISILFLNLNPVITHLKLTHFFVIKDYAITRLYVLCRR